MPEAELLSKKLTILVNSCDAYADIWPIFFRCLKKYWNTEGVEILLNTESLDYSFEGLAVRCVHFSGSAYGARMIHALREVRTKYVLPLLDDFFLRQPVDNRRVNQLVRWMEEDPRILCFNSEIFKTDGDLPCAYPGYKPVPPGTEYRLNMQAAVWRTDKLLRCWRPEVTPWEWEQCCEIRGCWHKNDLVFCRQSGPALFDYGNDWVGRYFAIHRGKWVEEDVVPFFEKEGIDADLFVRGFFDESAVQAPPAPDLGRMGTHLQTCRDAWRTLGPEGLIHVIPFECRWFFRKLAGKENKLGFYDYTRARARRAAEKR